MSYLDRERHVQNQPPDSNNPSNPLLKVAALTLDKAYAQEDPTSKTRVLVTLNFKRSSDMRGQTVTRSGDDVTVCFSLAIKRASLELRFYFEDAKAQHAAVKIERVAHLRGVHAQDRISDETAVKKISKRGLSLRLKGQAKGSLSGIGGAANMDGEAHADATTESTRKRRTARSVVRSNVAATYGGNFVHWEIEPNIIPDGKDSQASWLQGELFKLANGGSVDACHISWKPDPTVGAATIAAAVFVTMADLIVDDVRLQNSSGDTIPIWHLERGFGSLEVLSGIGTKERVVRQIIRKHLISQGMTTEGARVQICGAYT